MSVNDGGTEFVARLTEIAASTEDLLDRLLAGAPMAGERARPRRLRRIDALCDTRRRQAVPAVSGGRERRPVRACRASVR